MNPPKDATADVTPAEAAKMHRAATVIVLDVRERDEWDAGHVAGAVHIPLGDLDPATVDTSKPIIAVCRSGNRSGEAMARLRAAGITAHNMAGGMNAWVRDGLDVITADGKPGSI